jgi:uncharacterized protein (TIGR03083 family)
MTERALEAIRAERDVLLGICAGLGEGDWTAPSGCPGWSVQDVVAHVGALFWAVADPSGLPDTTGLPTERAQDAFVEHRRSWTPAEVVDDYQSISLRALDALGGLVDQEFEVPLGDLGTYPASMLSSAFAFDHFVHIRSDLFSPRGPLTGAPPPADALRLGPALDWIEVALPQQNADALGALGAGVEIELHGPGARVLHIGPGPAASLVRSDSAAFVRWITQRSTWEAAGVDATGVEGDLAITRTLRVF